MGRWGFSPGRGTVRGRFTTPTGGRHGEEEGQEGEEEEQGEEKGPQEEGVQEEVVLASLASDVRLLGT